jgi:hypothetical protein
VKFFNAELWLFVIVLVLLWFTNKQHDHIVYLEDTVKIQDRAMNQQSFLIECQKILIEKQGESAAQDFLPFYKKYD